MLSARLLPMTATLTLDNTRGVREWREALEMTWNFTSLSCCPSACVNQGAVAHSGGKGDVSIAVQQADALTALMANAPAVSAYTVQRCVDQKVKGAMYKHMLVDSRPAFSHRKHKHMYDSNSTAVNGRCQILYALVTGGWVAVRWAASRTFGRYRTSTLSLALELIWNSGGSTYSTAHNQRPLTDACTPECDVCSASQSSQASRHS